ncbi:MAG TPA: hypothetical protein VJK29_17340 [Terriglobales bacterium]|nr:hypothetical protein [Terriglobales bacterium]
MRTDTPSLGVFPGDGDNDPGNAHGKGVTAVASERLKKVLDLVRPQQAGEAAAAGGA